MRLSTPTERYERPDWGACPCCDAELVELAGEVTDDDFRDDEYRDVSAITCPACGKRIALVREHSYSLMRFAEPK